MHSISAKSLAIALMCMGVTSPLPVVAEGFPSRAITVIHPFTAGSATDVALRLICQKASELSGQQILVENRPGAGGAVGAAALKKAKPDGYTLMQVSQGTLAVAPHLAKNPPYDSIKDFQPITQLWEAATFLIVPASSPIKSSAELAATAKQRRGGLSNATQGIGSAGHVVGAMVVKSLGVPLTHIPYNGAAASKPDLLTGRVDMTFAFYGLFKGDIEEGKVRVLAVAAPTRVSVWPNIPTMDESGFPGVEYVEWFGLASPAGIEPKVADSISKLFARAVSDPSVAAKLASTSGFVVKHSTPAEFKQRVVASHERFGKLIQEMGIQPK
jgi:tripartite-type tricarboxylate transporter receptor subunit TctC